MPDETTAALQEIAVPRNSLIKAQLVFTLLLGVLPFIPYTNGRLFHGLPSEAQWDAKGGNGGPWHLVHPLDELIGLPMYLLAVMPVYTITSYLLTSLHQKRSMFFWQSIALTALTALQWGLLVLQLGTVFWLID